MNKTYKDIFWNNLRIYYNRMVSISSMSDYYEGVCWGLATAAYNMNVISTNTFLLICKLLGNTHRIIEKTKKGELKYANLSEV